MAENDPKCLRTLAEYDRLGSGTIWRVAAGIGKSLVATGPTALGVSYTFGDFPFTERLSIMARARTKKNRVRYVPMVEFPPLTPEEYEGLKSSILVSGVLIAILVDCDGPVRRIIDGKYRKKIADELGYDCPEIVVPNLSDDEMRMMSRALNLARRQLNTDQKRTIIADQLRETPERSARWIGKMLGVSGNTVSSVRAEMEADAQLEQLDKVIGPDGKQYQGSKAKHYWGERRNGLKRNADNPLDFHPTPGHVTKALIAREKFQGLILEPASGNGAIIRVFRKAGYTVTGTDIVTGTDFLKSKIAVANVVTNPPYSDGMAEKFCRQALAIAKNKVAMLLPMWFLEGVQRHDLFTCHPLKAIYIFSRRPKFGEQHDHQAPFGTCWVVWDKQFKGKPRIEWILD